VLDRGLVAHVAFADEVGPLCIPMLYARIGNELSIHGSTASRAMRALAGGAPACVTVTVVNGLVLARSAFEHSANYESAMVFGRFAQVEDEVERLRAFEAFTEKLLPGRWDEARRPSATELKATTILALPIEEASAKIRTGPPDDDDSPDAELDVWAGVLPIQRSFGEPEPSPGLRPGIALSPSAARLLANQMPPG
jgi:nitroimidazol reductase NimA-like FMN-containing flavoprotein (pyridoxamine 5'-phosphate oxidase superfamily)